MNPRIRLLAEQAGIDFFNSIDPEFSGREYCEAWTEQQQKFAELIVAECCQQINSQCFPSNSHEWCQKGAWNGYLVAQIREHFRDQ